MHSVDGEVIYFTGDLGLSASRLEGIPVNLAGPGAAGSRPDA